MKKLFAVYAGITPLLFILCGTYTDSDHAGGSGAGNPGVTASVSIIADTAAFTESAAKKISSAADLRTISVHDDGTVMFIVSSASFTIYKIHFLLADAETCEAIIDSFDTCLSCDSESIVLSGPIVFDAVNGSADLFPDSFSLPAARYTGMKIAAGCEADADSSVCSSSVITGKFEYRDTLRTFSFTVPFHFKLLYKYTGQPVEYNPGDSAFFNLRLDASGWLSNIDATALLDEYPAILDSEGNLMLGSDTPAIPSVRALLNSFHDNLAVSFSAGRIKMTRK